MQRRLVRAAMRIAARVASHLPWRSGDGVIGVVFTPAGRIVLVRHTYVDGWYPPGGGRGRWETAEVAVVRELREEIGLSSWSAIEALALAEANVDAFVVRDALYRPRRSLEIDMVAEFDADHLPSDVSPRLLGILSAVKRQSPTGGGAAPTAGWS